MVECCDNGGLRPLSAHVSARSDPGARHVFVELSAARIRTVPVRYHLELYCKRRRPCDYAKFKSCAPQLCRQRRKGLRFEGCNRRLESTRGELILISHQSYPGSVGAPLWRRQKFAL